MEAMTPGSWQLALEQGGDEETPYDRLTVDVEEGATVHVRLGAPPPEAVRLHGRIPQEVERQEEKQKRKQY